MELDISRIKGKGEKEGKIHIQTLVHDFNPCSTASYINKVDRNISYIFKLKSRMTCNDEGGPTLDIKIESDMVRR